jgi:DNA-cytosine methyltransferase
MKSGINVLSLFDGMSCGQIALARAGVKVGNYFASEIDRHAIQVARENYPNTKHLGGVKKVKGFDLPRIDLLIGGSPCQGFSFAGKQLNFDDPRSKLFFEFVRLLKETNPKYFLLENVLMKREYQDVISEQLGVEPILINSALVSAQNRRRLYWTNIPRVAEPKDKNILLEDIVDSGIVDRNKSYCIDANYFKGGNLNQYFKKHRRQLVFCGALRGRYLVDGKRQDGKMKTAGLTTQRMEVRYDGKTNCLTSVQKDNHLVFIDGFRKLTPLECERLQTVPENYTSCVSNTQRYKMLGNGWTVDVVAHIFSSAEFPFEEYDKIKEDEKAN